jgi:4-amino-4-deoxy-L-arabinose transferase-like glycosyltransferase
VKQLIHIHKTRYYALAVCLLFLTCGLLFLPHLGLQNDEALFASPWFQPKISTYLVNVGHSRIPLMLMTYLGTLKSWIYRPLFFLLGTSIWVIRLPMLLAGAASIWVFYLFLRRVAGERAGMVGCSFLAADSLYLLTVCFDWGPVALQHLLLLSGLLLLVRFYQTLSHRSLGWGWALLGLAMWDKALAIWMLAGFGVAGITVLKKEIVGVINLRRLLLSAACFCLGAFPLLVYNVKNHWATFRSNASWETGDIPGKARLLRGTADGHALFGWLVYEDWQTHHPHEPDSLLTKTSAQISALAGQPRQNVMPYAFLLALLLTPLACSAARKAILFALVALLVAWLQMAVTVNAGGSVHHAILVWPLPQMVIAVSFAAASRRLGRRGIPVLIAVTAVVAISCVLVTNEYYTRMRRNGGGMNWTDAVLPLADRMKTVPAKLVFSVDWGIMDSLRLLDRGKLPLRVGTDPITRKELSDEDRQYLATMIGSPEHVFINHAKDFEFFQGVNDKLVKYAEAAGYRRVVESTVADGYGRPVYEVYRFVKAE